MSLLRFYKSSMPFISFFSSLAGLNIGLSENSRCRYGYSHTKSEISSIDMYSNIIGFTTIGCISGITYPISFPLYGCYVVYKNYK